MLHLGCVHQAYAPSPLMAVDFPPKLMKHAWVACWLVSLTLAPSLGAAQPLLEMDPCGYASFPDKAKRDEYAALASRLSSSQPHRSVLEEWRTTAKALRTRMSDELFELWNATYGAVQGAVRSPMLDDVQAVLTERCLNRVRRTPQKETDVIRADIERMRSLLALSEAEFAKQFRARMKMTRDALGAPHAAGDTLRANLQLPTPNWFQK